MLLEDLRNNVIPYKVRESDEERFLELVSSSERVSGLVARSLRFPNYDQGWPLLGALRDFCGQCVVELVAEGSVTYEIFFFQEHNKNVGFGLFPIQERSLRRINGKVFQQMPQWYLKSTKGLQDRIELPQDRLLVIEEPPHYKGVFKQMMNSVTVASGPYTPFGVDLSANTIGYSFSDHNRSRLRLLAEATRRIGWAARGMFDDVATEHYTLVRRLKWELFLIHMRGHLVKQLNRAFEIAGSVVGFEAFLRVANLPTEEMVNAALSQLHSGGMTFKDILSPFQ